VSTVATARTVAIIGLSRVQVELLQFFRETQALVFIFFFPVVMLVIFASVFNGSDFIETAGVGITGAQYYLTGMIATGVMLSSFQALSITIAVERDNGTLKLLHGTPMPAMAYFIGKVGQVVVTTLIQIALLLAVARLAYGVPLPGSADKWFRLVWLLVLGAASGTALGIAFAAVPRSGRTAANVVTPVVLVLQFISGVYFPYNQLPSWMHAIASVFPLKWMAQGMRSVLLPAQMVHAEPGGSWQIGTGAVVLAVWLVVGLVIASRTFRWVTERRA
jgi:ABC-2 type transport system permease protein